MMFSKMRSSVTHRTFHKATMTLSNLYLATLQPSENPLSLGIAEFEKLSAGKLRKQKAIQKERSERQLIREREIHREHKAFALIQICTLISPLSPSTKPN